MAESSRRHVAICPGSYDPITKGHVDLLERASRLFGTVVVAVAIEAQKEHLFAIDERVDMAREACAHLTGVEVISFDGLLVEAARGAGAVAIVKGLRDPFDVGHEAQMVHMNRSLMPDLETIFILSAPEYAHVSSGLIKWVCRMGGDITPHVPAYVAEKLRAKLRPPA